MYTLNVHLEATVIVPKKSQSVCDRQFLQKINDTEHVYVLSAHLDDAVLSMGSLITFLAKKKIDISVITCFTEGFPGTSKTIETLLRNAGFSDSQTYFSARRDEDTVALKTIGASSIFHLGYVDSAWRRSKGNALYPDSQLTTMLPQDEILLKELRNKLKKYIDVNKNTLIFAPLARGKHVDHQIVRNIACSLFNNAIFYQDFPYSALYENENTFIEYNALKGVVWKGDYRKKATAILQYETQRYSLFYKGAMRLPYEKYYLKTY